MLKKINDLAQTRAAFYVALFLFGLSAFSTFWYGHITGFSDEGHYWSLANGMHHGKFSAWYFLPVDTPDTLRTWGYPFFLYCCQLISPTYMFVQIVQLVLFALTIMMCLRIIRHYYPPLIYRTVFLTLLICNNHISFYAGVLVAECVFIFFLTLFIYTYIFYREKLGKYLLLGLYCFILYQLRPIFLLFPFLFVIYLALKRTNRVYNLAFIALFVVSLIPFGLWNKKHHGVFKITPLEGGNGVMYQGGYWDYRLPTGFSAPYYWGMAIDDDLLEPSFLPEAEKQKETARYIMEWEGILKELKAKGYTNEDSIREQLMADSSYKPLRNFIIYGSSYTLAREKLLKSKLLGEIKDHPGFYFRTRLYNFFRQWVTGINAEQLRQAQSFTGYIKVLYPFIISFLFIFCGLIFVLIQLVRKKLPWRKFSLFILLIAYFSIVNLPFGVMSRYTVPVHLLILIMLSVCLVHLLMPSQKKTPEVAS